MRTIQIACPVIRVGHVKPVPRSKRLGRVPVGEGHEVVVCRAEWRPGSLGVHLPPGALVPRYAGGHLPVNRGGVSPSRLHDIFGLSADDGDDDRYARQIGTYSFGDVVSHGVLIPLGLFGIKPENARPDTDVSDALGVRGLAPRGGPHRWGDEIRRREAVANEQAAVAKARTDLDGLSRAYDFARRRRLHPGVREVVERLYEGATNAHHYHREELRKLEPHAPRFVTHYVITTAVVLARRAKRIEREKAECVASMKSFLRDYERVSSSWRALEVFATADTALSTLQTEARDAHAEARSNAARLRKLIRGGKHGRDCDCRGIE